MRKYYEVIDVVIVSNEEEIVVLDPGDIVEIEFDDVPNEYPCLVMNGEMYDIAFEDDEFPMFFKEVKN